MTRRDWALGPDRKASARERILAEAAELVSRYGFEALTVEKLAATVHCSPATVYRHAGGKVAISEALISRFSEQIASSVNNAIAGLRGTERVVGAILVGLEHMRAEPLGQLIIGDIRPGRDGGTVNASRIVTKIAEGMIGHSDPLAAQWLFHITFSLWYWPLKDKAAEEEMVRRFAAPSVMQGLRM